MIMSRDTSALDFNETIDANSGQIPFHQIVIDEVMKTI